MNAHLRQTAQRFTIAAGLLALTSGHAIAQYCAVGSTYFASNYGLAGCTVGSCWAPAPFAGSIPIAGSYPSTNYACATTAPGAGALSNTLYTYDANGNLTVTKDPLGRSTTNSFDALNRLTQVFDPASGTTKYGYNSNGELKQVTDPRNLVTSYTRNGLGDTTTLTSPDTGSTASTFDAAGNLKTRLDARGVTATYTYDAINRATKVVYSKTGSSSETHTYTWDGGTTPPPYSKGRLTKLVDPAAITAWTYEAHGRVLTKTQTVGQVKTVSYTYNAAGQLATLTTPSGQVIAYSYSNNRVSGITVNGAPLISAAIAEPFGPLSTWAWGNGHLTLRVYDDDGRLASWEFRNGASVLRNNLSWDVANRITAITDPAATALGCVFQYDNMDRLTVSQLGLPVSSTQQFGYDAVGNRQNFTLNSTLTNYTYASTSHQLLALSGGTSKSYVYDAAGNPTTIGALTYTYNLANRLTAISNGGTTVASYKGNALGQRVQKVVGSVTTRFVYDEQGRLLGEYDGSGKLIQETVWLDDLPVATLRPTGATGTPTPINVYYVHADHLGSPRAITRPSDNAFMWRWDNADPFGNNAANENPGGLGTFKYALRFPGQYFDTETATHYNYYRDYDPVTGRYIQSDPIGLEGGINTYAYVNSNSMSGTDAVKLVPLLATGMPFTVTFKDGSPIWPVTITGARLR